MLLVLQLLNAINCLGNTQIVINYFFLRWAARQSAYEHLEYLVVVEHELILILRQAIQELKVWQ